MRLEHLIGRLRYHEADDSVWGRRAAMDALLDVLNVMSRYDTRGEVSKELGLRYGNLERLADRDDIDSTALTRVLTELDDLGRDMQRMPPQFASYQIRDNELLNSLNNRMSIPGGSCSFDLPAYQHWLSQGNRRIEQDFEDWCRRIAPFEKAIATVLRLLRASTTPASVTADAGVLVHNTEANTQMVRVLLTDASVYPEISAGRHRATIRFMQYDDSQLHVRQTQSPVHFRMACCRF
ncbi:cell division protein ZapD [Salinisphaera aquimarina]|uniref:Cell division protein ZapD n=1 Tax=Salinisphaera aquimarina TaxID=2094031 RepID=A0ABV7EIA1_9GAMM